jgi:lactoylglutathione lyase
MKLSHVHLMVADVCAASAFFEKYFGLQKISGNAGLTVLLDEDGFVLTLMKVRKKANAQYPDSFHVGFFVESEAKVDAINHRLKDDGCDVAPPQRQHAYTFDVVAPGGFLVEIGA